MSRKKEEKNIAAIMAIRQQPGNRKCMDCGANGPQCVCLDLLTFVCMSCAGLHREQNRRVKGITMSHFTDEEVERFQNGGNKACAKRYLAKWKPRDFPMPEPGKKDKILEFMTKKYIDQKWFRASKSRRRADSESDSDSSSTDDARKRSHTPRRHRGRKDKHKDKEDRGGRSRRKSYSRNTSRAASPDSPSGSDFSASSDDARSRRRHRNKRDKDKRQDKRHRDKNVQKTPRKVEAPSKEEEPPALLDLDAIFSKQTSPPKPVSAFETNDGWASFDSGFQGSTQAETVDPLFSTATAAPSIAAAAPPQPVPSAQKPASQPLDPFAELLTPADSAPTANNPSTANPDNINPFDVHSTQQRPPMGQNPFRDDRSYATNYRPPAAPNPFAYGQQYPPYAAGPAYGQFTTPNYYEQQQNYYQQQHQYYAQQTPQQQSQPIPEQAMANLNIKGGASSNPFL